MTTRRLFLLGAASILAAPAIVRAESLMKIVVPRRDWLIHWGPTSEFLIEKEGLDIFMQQTGVGNHPAFLRLLQRSADQFYGREIVGADWPTRTIKAPPSGFKFARG